MRFAISRYGKRGGEGGIELAQNWKHWKEGKAMSMYYMRILSPERKDCCSFQRNLRADGVCLFAPAAEKNS